MLEDENKYKTMTMEELLKERDLLLYKKSEAEIDIQETNAAINDRFTNYNDRVEYKEDLRQERRKLNNILDELNEVNSLIDGNTRRIQ